MDPRVFYAAQNGDIHAIERLYKENPELLREVTIQKNNVLHIAAREGHSRFVEWILQNVQRAGSMCSARNADKNTVMHEAAKGCDAVVFSKLIGLVKDAEPCGAKVLSKLLNIWLLHLHNRGYSFSILFQPLQLLRPLRDFNGWSYWITRENKFGQTPLLVACEYGNEDPASLLLEASTPINLLYPRYQACLHVTALEGHLGIVKLLLDKSKSADIWGNLLFRAATYGNPLHESVCGGNIEVVKEILLHAPSNFRKRLMKEKDELGRCAIHVAVVKGRYDIIDELMSSMPDCVEMRSSEGRSVLHFAVAYDRFQLVHKLLSDREQGTVAKLLSYDRDDLGNNALHMAAQNKVDPQLVEYLLSFKGVNVNALNNEGQTALDIAVENSNNDIIRILEEHGACNSPLFNDINVTRSPSEKEREKESKAMEVDTLVASLVATVTFAAIFQVPGGIQDDKNSSHYGVSRLAFHPYFTVFLVSDMVAFLSSLIVVMGWIFRGRPRKANEKLSLFTSVNALSLGVSIICTGIAFISAVYLVTIPPNLKALKTANNEAFLKYRKLYLLEFCGWIIIVTIFLTIRRVSGGISREGLLFSILCYIIVIFLGFQFYNTIMELK